MERALPGAPPDLRALPECCVRDRVERVVQRAELPRDDEEPLVRLEVRVDPLELLGDPVEPLEQRVELPVGDVWTIHRTDSTQRVTGSGELAPPDDVCPGEHAQEGAERVDRDVERRTDASLDECLV